MPDLFFYDSTVAMRRLLFARSHPLSRKLILFGIAFAALAHPCRSEQTTATSEMLIRLTVQAAPAPKPALRYRLLPELKEMNPGNPIQNYMKCMMEQKKFFFDEEAVQNREALLAMPLKELPAQELKENGRYVLSQVDWAARLDNPDWQVLLKLKADGIELLLPEVQQIRSLARALQVRFRAEIAQCRFDDAIRTAKTMFAISRHLSEHPTLIGNLVGMAIASVTIYHVDEMLVQPGCPNLYWALTTLPSPFISLETGMDGERVMMACVFRDLDDRAPMSKSKLEKFVVDAEKLLELGEQKPGKTSVRAWLDAHTKDEAMVSAARGRLVEYGFAKDRLSTFPADQVILMDEKRELEMRFDEDAKTRGFPFWQAIALVAPNKPKPPPALFADFLVPITLNCRMAQGRVDQRIALLRHVEALRLHAALHDGALPAKLSDVAVPLPVDPITGKSFRYELIGSTAHLRGTPPPGQEKVPPYNVHYEITIQR
jgi:hypothetical protein